MTQQLTVEYIKNYANTGNLKRINQLLKIVNETIEPLLQSKGILLEALGESNVTQKTLIEILEAKPGWNSLIFLAERMTEELTDLEAYTSKDIAKIGTDLLREILPEKMIKRRKRRRGGNGETQICFTIPEIRQLKIRYGMIEPEPKPEEEAEPEEEEHSELIEKYTQAITDQINKMKDLLM